MLDRIATPKYEKETTATPCNQSELIKALGAPTKLDLVFWAAITQSTVWAASTRPDSTVISIVWLVLAVLAGVAELAGRLWKAPNDRINWLAEPKRKDKTK